MQELTSCSDCQGQGFHWLGGDIPGISEEDDDRGAPTNYQGCATCNGWGQIIPIWAMQRAAQCWCYERVSDRTMDRDLCTVFARELAQLAGELESQHKESEPCQT